jgi:EmrB/QacA subfamily drug resistance transporter
MGIFMLLLDITVVNVALPDLATDLDASFSDLQWVIDAYSLSLAALLLVLGSLGDRIGHRRVFGAGLVVFTASSLACGLVSDPLALNVARAVQGLGGSAMFATSLALIAREFRGRERGTAFGVWGATAGAAVAVGPLLGGVLTTGLSWRWIFFLNLPIGVAALALLVAKVRETPRREIHPDWIGAALFSGSLVGIVYALIRGNADGWGSAGIVAALAAGGALLAVFLAVEAVRDEPMLELRRFRAPAFTGVSLSAFAMSASLFSSFLYITLYLQNVLGYSALSAGLRFLPLTLVVLAAAPIAGRLTERVPLRFLIGVGLALVGIGLVLMAGVSVDDGWTTLLAGFVVAGLGSGLTNPPLASGAIRTVPADQPGVGSGVNNTFRQVGIATGIAALGALFESRIHSSFTDTIAQSAPALTDRAGQLATEISAGAGARVLEAVPPQLRETVGAAARSAFVDGLNAVFWCAAAIALAGAVLALWLIRQSGLSAEGAPAAAKGPDDAALGQGEPAPG